jgi:hypothetical protein
LKVKDVIIQRHKDYSKMLARELAIAKNIMKNPKLFKKTWVAMNYDAVELYRLPARYLQPLRESKSVDKEIAFQSFSHLEDRK